MANKPGWYTDLDTYSGPKYKLSDGTLYYTWIDYDGLNQNVQVHLGTSPDRASASKILDVSDIDLGSVFGGKSFYAGFTASTGEPYYEYHDIHSWYFVNEYAPIDTLDSPNDYKVNQPPTAPDDARATAVNTPVSGQLFGTDPDGDPLTYSKGTAPGNGNVIVNSDGTWIYTPDSGFTGVDEFSVFVSDGKCENVEARITVEVTDSVPPPLDICPNRVALINGSFEDGPAQGSFDPINGPFMFYESEVPGWKTTDEAAGPGIHLIEIWDYAQGYPNPTVTQQPAPKHGNRYAELNAVEDGMLYQDVETTPGQTIYWRLSHKGLYGVDTMQLRIGPATADPYDTSVIKRMSDDNTAWGTYSGIYTVPTGQTVTRFGFEAVSTANGSIGHGNHLDDIFLGTEPCVVASKTASAQEVNIGDEVTYEIQIKNEGGDIAANTSVTDFIPEGTEYVPGSMKLIQESAIKDLTDAADTDEGQFDGSKVSIQLGNLANTSQLADGVTVQFKVKVLSNAWNPEIRNKAQIHYDNLLTDTKEQIETNETTTLVRTNPPDLESSKTAALLLKAAGNTDPDHPEPGDTLLYTIQARNTVEDSLVRSFVISDDIPAGLQYVPGSMKVDGNSVTDAGNDNDGGLYADGRVVALFGDITDTNWHKLEFAVVIEEGQAGKNIRNIAIIGGENVDTPSRAEEEVKVYPRHPILESEKFAVNLEPGKNTFEVGDTVAYKIQTRNLVNGSLISDLKITDTLPEGLKYVPGSLKVNGSPVTDAEGDDSGHFVTGAVYGGFGDVQDMEWRTLEFNAVIQSGQAGKNIRNIAVVSGDGIQVPSMPEEEIKVYPRKPIIASEKSAVNLEAGKDNFEVGDTVIYTIRARTVVSDTYIDNLVISDTLPAGLEFIPGSLKVDGNPVTDDYDNDNGHYASDQVAGHFGEIWDTKWHTLEFRAKIVGNAGQTIRNTGEITGDNIDEPGRPTKEITVEEGGTPPVNPPIDPPVDPPVTPPDVTQPDVTPPDVTTPAPVIESRKTLRDIHGGVIEVGDTIEYTISVRNTVAGSHVSNLVISDILPAELKYVAGSLKVDGQSVTDAVDSDKGSYVDGKVSGRFGDIADLSWHSIVFQAELVSGQAGQTIRNTGVVAGDNLTNSDRPYEDIIVGNGSGNNPGIPGTPGDTNDGSSSGNPNNPEGENSDTAADSNPSGENGSSSGADAAGESDVTSESDGSGQTGQSGSSSDSVNLESGDREGTGSKLPNTATNMYSYLLAGCILLLAGLFLIRRKRA